MASFEKIVQFDRAVLEPEAELLRVSAYEVKLRALDNLVFLCHLDGEPGPSGRQFFGATGEAVTQTPLCSLNHQLDYGEKQFGSSSLYHSGDPAIGAVLCEPVPEMLFAPALTVDFWARFSSLNTGGCERRLADRFSDAGLLVNSWKMFLKDGELGLRLATSEGMFVLQSSGLDLTANNWHHIRASWSELEHSARIFADGSEAASGAFTGTVLDSQSLNYRSPLALLHSLAQHEAWMDEFRVFTVFMGDGFTPPDLATKPFSANVPRVMSSVDAGFQSATWFPAELGFLDENDFGNLGIKIRVHADDDNTREFSGDPLSLAQVRSLSPMVGRWLHFEFSLFSDGDTPRRLTVGRIGIKPVGQAVARRAPEAVRKA